MDGWILLYGEGAGVLGWGWDGVGGFMFVDVWEGGRFGGVMLYGKGKGRRGAMGVSGLWILWVFVGTVGR